VAIHINRSQYFRIEFNDLPSVTATDDAWAVRVAFSAVLERDTAKSAIAVAVVVAMRAILEFVSVFKVKMFELASFASTGDTYPAFVPPVIVSEENPAPAAVALAAAVVAVAAIEPFFWHFSLLLLKLSRFFFFIMHGNFNMSSICLFSENRCYNELLLNI